MIENIFDDSVLLKTMKFINLYFGKNEENQLFNENNGDEIIKLLGKNLRLPDEEKYEIVKSMEKINIVRLKKRTKSIKISWNSFPLILTAQKKKEQSKNEQ